MKKTVAVLVGGFSEEVEISRKSAACVAAHIDRTHYDVYLIEITKEGWKHVASDMVINKNDFSLSLDDRKITFDLVFPMIHGTPFEDGLLQGYFESLHIPHTTCNTFISSLTFHKYFCKQLLSGYGIATARCRLVRKGEDLNLSRIEQLGFPLFVKPNAHGSSFGISKVTKQEDLAAAIRHGFEFDEELIVEEFVAGREFTCGAFRQKGKIISLPLTEIIPYAEYFDFAAKYENASDEITPADLPEDLTADCQAITRRIYDVLGCRGMIRADFILKEKVFHLIEVNTIPGMTEQSLIPQQVRAAGWTLADFLTVIIEEALDDGH